MTIFIIAASTVRSILKSLLPLEIVLVVDRARSGWLDLVGPASMTNISVDKLKFTKAIGWLARLMNRQKFSSVWYNILRRRSRHFARPVTCARSLGARAHRRRLGEHFTLTLFISQLRACISCTHAIATDNTCATSITLTERPRRIRGGGAK